MITNEEDKNLKITNNKYTVTAESENYLLKRYRIKKKPFLYSFIGGMWYTKDKFNLEQEISLPYPFKTYYTKKILDKNHDGKLFRSLIYAKMPVFVLQFKDECVLIDFDPVIKINNQEAFPFISLGENDEEYIVSFYLFTNYTVKEKEHPWLGLGKKKAINLKLKKGDTFNFNSKITLTKNWEKPVQEFIKNKLPKKIEIENPELNFNNAKKALLRSYDYQNGAFLQLPWRETPGFTFVNSSYTLLSYEAVRLHYFTNWYEKTKDEKFLFWQKKLRELFLNPSLKTKPKKGKGIVWYNMTNLTKKGLQGFFYLDCGYSGYPGGQATISYHLLRYLEKITDEKLEEVVKKSLKYILSTQNKDGSWPMAIRQDGGLRIRRENLEDFVTYGGTGECARALLLGYKRFKDIRMKDAALKALKFLETEKPLCINGLRDIGLQEPEAFSAVSIVDAYLDAYEETLEKQYLQQAKTYASHILTWFYTYNTKNWELEFNFHPISYSITPRLSPYEAVWIVSTFNRLTKITKNKLWQDVAKVSYSKSTRWITKNGGLSEGIFPTDEGLKPLPMEQTFATVELMKSSSEFFKLQRMKENQENKKDKDVKLKKQTNSTEVAYNGEELLSFDLEKLKIDLPKHKKEIYFSFFKPYSTVSKLKMKIKKHLRGKAGKFILGAGEAKYFLKGVYGPKALTDINLKTLEKVKNKKLEITIKDDCLTCICETDLHRFKTKISATKKGKNIHVFFNPIVIEVLGHDLNCKQILFPLVNDKSLKQSNKELIFKGFKIKGDLPEIIISEKHTAVDQTLSTNWTHGGIYQGAFEIIIEI